MPEWPLEAQFQQGKSRIVTPSHSAPPPDWRGESADFKAVDDQELIYTYDADNTVHCYKKVVLNEDNGFEYNALLVGEDQVVVGRKRLFQSTDRVYTKRGW